MNFSVERTHPTAITVRMNEIQAGWEQWFLLRSDCHLDSPYCDRAMAKRHLDEAKERNAGILDLGDNYDAMQGKFDKRADQDQLLPELRAPNQQRYSDALVSYHAAFYKPYAANWILLAQGNHEEAFERRAETNLTERLAERFKAAGSLAEWAGPQGWVRFLFVMQKTKRSSVRLRYHHGYGGGGPVTRDMIQAQRQMAMLGNADIIVSGHTHDCWHAEVPVETLDHLGMPQLNTVDLVKVPGYKDEYTPGKGWAAMKGMPPKPKGAWWLRFWVQGDDVRREFTRAS